MIGDGPRNGFRVPPSNINAIRKTTDNVLEFFKYRDNIQHVRMSQFLDQLSLYGITYDVLESEDMPSRGVEACCIPENWIMCIRHDVYKKACNQEPRARFTIMHEFGHLMLGHSRTINREVSKVPLKTYEDSEWQANQFAAELLMPFSVIKDKGLKTEKDIQAYFNVSTAAACMRLKQLNTRGEL